MRASHGAILRRAMSPEPAAHLVSLPYESTRRSSLWRARRSARSGSNTSLIIASRAPASSRNLAARQTVNEDGAVVHRNIDVVDRQHGE